MENEKDLEQTNAGVDGGAEFTNSETLNTSVGATEKTIHEDMLDNAEQESVTDSVEQGTEAALPEKEPEIIDHSEDMKAEGMQDPSIGKVDLKKVDVLRDGLLPELNNRLNELIALSAKPAIHALGQKTQANRIEEAKMLANNLINIIGDIRL